MDPLRVSGWADWVLVAELDAKIAAYGIWRKTLDSRGENIASELLIMI